MHPDSQPAVASKGLAFHDCNRSSGYPVVRCCLLRADGWVKFASDAPRRPHVPRRRLRRRCSPGCGSRAVISPTPVTVIGTLPAATVEPATPAFALTGDPVAGKALFLKSGCTGCHTLADAKSTGTVGPNLDDAKPDYRTRDRARHARQGRDAVLQGSAHRPADRRRRLVRGEGDRRHAVALLELPPSFPRRVAAFAFDLDRTLIAEDAVLRPAHARGDPRRASDGRARDHRDGAHVPLDPPVRRRGGARRSARLLPGRRRGGSGDRGVPPARLHSPGVRARGDRRRDRGRVPHQLLRRRQPLRREGDPRGPRVRRLQPHRGPRGRRPARRG